MMNLNEFYKMVNGKEYRYIVVDFIEENEKFDENDELVGIEDCVYCMVEDVEKDEILSKMEYVFESEMKDCYDLSYEN